MAKYKVMPLGVLDTERDLYIPETDAALWGAYQDWLTAGNVADVFDPTTELPMGELTMREFRMSRVAEDLIDVLITKGVITLADLPQDAQDRIAEKKWLRAQLGL